MLWDQASIKLAALWLHTPPNARAEGMTRRGGTEMLGPSYLLHHTRQASRFVRNVNALIPIIMEAAGKRLMLTTFQIP